MVNLCVCFAGDVENNSKLVGSSKCDMQNWHTSPVWLYFCWGKHWKCICRFSVKISKVIRVTQWRNAHNHCSSQNWQGSCKIIGWNQLNCSHPLKALGNKTVLADCPKDDNMGGVVDLLGKIFYREDTHVKRDPHCHNPSRLGVWMYSGFLSDSEAALRPIRDAGDLNNLCNILS